MSSPFWPRKWYERELSDWDLLCYAAAGSVWHHTQLRRPFTEEICTAVQVTRRMKRLVGRGWVRLIDTRHGQWKEYRPTEYGKTLLREQAEGREALEQGGLT